MSEEHRKDVPQIAITAYESTEEDAEVNSLFNSTTIRNNNKTRQSRSVSPKLFKLKSRIILKSPTPDNSTNISKSLSPVLSSDFNYLTDVEVMSDSDDEKDFVRTPRLTLGSIDYCILTDVEDLSEDERQLTSIQVNGDHTDTEYFDEKKGFLNKDEQTRQHVDDILDFPRPHREILFHSKDGVIRTLTPTDETNPVWSKIPLEEIKGFESEEEIITMEENDVYESCKANLTPYYHDVDGGVVESSESVKPERNKQKYKTTKKKIAASETECLKKCFRNRNQNNSDGEGNVGKHFSECEKNLSKYASEPITTKMTIPLQLQVKNKNLTKLCYEEPCKNNKLVIHDNVNGFSVSVDFESHNSILLSIGRESGNLSLRWYNDGTKAVKPKNIVQYYINKQYQIQIPVTKSPLVNICSLKDQFMNQKRLHPSSITGLSAFKVFSREYEAKDKGRKKIVLESRKYVADVIQIFENMRDNPSVRHTINYKTSQHYYKNPRFLTSRRNVSYMVKSNNKIGNEVNFAQLENAKPINSSDSFSKKMTASTKSGFNQMSLDRAINQSREELDKLIKAVDDLENRVNMEEQLVLTNDYYTDNYSDSEDSFDVDGSLEHLQTTVFRLLNDVHDKENQLLDSFNDIRKSLNDLDISKVSQSSKLQKLSEPSLRSNFKTASLPYQWWNRSMPCLSLIKHHDFITGSQESLNGSLNISYFTPKKKRSSISKFPSNENSGYCIWLPNNTPENDRRKIRPLMVRTPSESTVPDNFERLDEWKPLDYSEISPDSVQEKLKTMLSEPGDRDETLTNFLIDMLIEQETAKLAASGELSSGSSDSDSHECLTAELSSSPNPVPIISSPKVRRNGVGGSQRLPSNQRPTLREMRQFNDSDSDNEFEYIVTEPQEKSPGRKVTFRLESEDDEIIYPSESGDESESEVLPSNIEQSMYLENIKFDVLNNAGEKTLKRVERRFERMASETLEDSPIAKNAVEGEYHRIVSQLSTEDVEVANQLWNTAEPSPELTTNTTNIVHQISIDKIPPKPNPRNSIDSSIKSTLDENDANYSTKKQFWEKITQTASQPPLPKPRYSISLPINTIERSMMKNSSLEIIEKSFGTSEQTEMPEMIKETMISDQTTNNDVVSDSTCQNSKDVNEKSTSVEKCKISEGKRLDSETEYIIKYGEESLAFENEGFQEDVFDEKVKGGTIEQLNLEKPNISPTNVEIENIPSKQYFKQIKPQMEGIQMEQESSPEHKSLKNTTSQKSPSQEVLINRQIHKHIFSDELDEQIDSLIPEEKHFEIKFEKEFSSSSPFNTQTEKTTSSISEQSITKTESIESSVVDELPEEKENKLISKHLKYSSSLTQDHIDEIPLDTCSGLEEKGKSHLQTESIDSSMIEELQYDCSSNFPEEGNHKSRTEIIKEQIIHTPEEHIPDTIWEVTQIRTDNQNELEDLNIKEQTEFHKNFVKQVDSIDSVESTKKEITDDLARDIAEQLVNEIEIELTKRQDILANLQHLVVSPEHLKQLENSGYLDMDGDDLKLKIMESVLAKKNRDQLKSISKNDTMTSSIEITDEDLKSSNFEIECEGLTKLSVIDDIIPENENNRLKESPTEINSRYLSEHSSHEENKKFCEKSDNLIIEGYIKNKENEKSVHSEVEQNEEFPTGNLRNESVSNKNHKDLTTNVGENLILNLNEQKIEIKEMGLHDESSDNNLSHDVVQSIQTRKDETGKIIEQQTIEIDDHESHTRNCFDVETEHTEHNKNNETSIKEKHIDTILKDSDEMVKKKIEQFEEITDDGRIIINENKEEYHTSTYILKETSINNKNEITISNNDSPLCSSKSIVTLVKHLSTESLPSKDNSIHSPTSPSSSSIDVHEEKHVNFDSVVLRKPNSINVTKLTAKRPADSSSSESHYQSFDLTSSSRPCSSDIDGLLAGSSEYESAMSIPSNEYHTAISSLSSKESMKSLDSESSGNLASVENSEASETLIASTGDLDYDIDISNNLLEEENKLEPYEKEIPMQIIRGDSLPIIAEQSEMKYSSMYKTQPFSQPSISANSEKNVQKMKRSHEMMFHPIPKHITSDSLSDSSSHEERHQSSESMSISSTEGQIIQTVIDAIEGFSESGPCSFSLSDENTRSIETSTITNGFNCQEKNQDITIMSSSSTESGENNNVSTQITTKVEEVPKRGHRRNSSSINKIVIEDLNLIPKKESPIGDPSIENVTSNQIISNQNLGIGENIAIQEQVKIITSDIKTENSATTRYHETEIHASPILEKHSFEHIDDVAEADAAFQMVPHVSPAIPASLPPTIPEDPYSEDEDDLVDDSSNLVPNIMVTEHMTPLVDSGFHYPDLDLEAKELEIKSTPETPASISSKESSETDQGREYIINETFNPHEELSWTADEHTVLEKVEEKDSFSMSESFELVDNVDEKPDLEDDFVIVEEIGKEANEEDAEGQPIQIECIAKNAHSHIDTNANSSLKKLDSESYGSKEQELVSEYANQKWVELQFEDDNTVNGMYGYNLEYDRLPLEDIKEEDTEDLHSSKVGSVGSQVSQSIGSLGSMKESFSSTPESKKYLGKALEHDNLSVSSLQEFERLEQLVRIESMKAKSSGSLASTTSSSNSKREDQSLGSLNDFEAMEAACIQTEIIENKAMATEKALIDDENEFKTNGTGKQTEINVEPYDDNSEKLVSEDDNLTSTESLDLKTIVTDMKPSRSIEQIIVDGRTNDYDDCMNSSISSRGLSSPILDDHSKESSYRNSLILGSNDSLGPTSSTGTNATYHCETGSNMSSSFTSGGSNTMVSSMEGLDKAGTKPDLLEDPEIFETHWRDSDGTEYTHRTVRMPAEIHKVTARGPEKENILDDYIEQFSPGEYQEQTIHTDKRGSTYATKIVQKRMIFDPEELSSQGISKEELKECLKKLSGDHSEEFEYSKPTPKRNSGPAEESQETSVPGPHNVELQDAVSKPELKCEISLDDDTEIDLREHDWRFQHQINTETEDITKPGPSGCTGKPKSKGQNSETVSEL